MLEQHRKDYGKEPRARLRQHRDEAWAEVVHLRAELATVAQEIERISLTEAARAMADAQEIERLRAALQRIESYGVYELGESDAYGMQRIAAETLTSAKPD